jgi:putative ABC transport system permease protein
MRWHTRLVQRLRDLVAWEARDADIQQEMQFHLDALAQEYMKGGLSEADARLAAKKQFGSPVKLKEQGHDVRGGSMLEEIVREVRHAARRLVRTPGFTLAAVLTLALAIGANASIFTIVHRVVLNPLPYADSDRLIELDHGAARINVPSGMGMKVGLYHYYSDRARTLDGIAIFTAGDVTLRGDGDPERVRVTRTTTTLASLLGVRPVVGRWFSDAEGEPGAPPVAIISHGLWTRRYGSDAGVVGRRVTIDGVPTDVVGVMPADFAFPDPTVAMWLPQRVVRTAGLGIWTDRGVARLRGSATVADVRAEINGLIRDLPQAFPGDPLVGATGAGIGVMSTARPLKEAMIGDIAATLWILLAAVGVVLLVASANVANLLLVRAEARQREVAVRRALGAGAGRIAWLFLAESVLLSIVAAVAGLLLAWGGVRLLVAAAPANLPRLGEVRVDGLVIAFTFLLSIVTALVFGSMPFYGAARRAVSLEEGGRRTTASRGRQRARQMLMGAQVALALILVASSGLMVRSFWELRGIDPQFDPASALTFSVGLPLHEYPDRDAALAAHQAILDRISEVGGVADASASTCLPLTGTCFGNGIVVEGRESLPAERSPGTTSFRAVAGGYFETMGIRVHRGRSIDRGDVERGEPVAVVDDAFADLVFPNEDPIGRRVSWTLPPAAQGKPSSYTWLTIVGVASSVPMRTLGESVRNPQIYMPMSLTGQFGAPPWEYIGPRVSAMNYVVRSTALPAGLLSAVRRAIDAVDPNLAMAQVSTLQERLDRASAGMAFTMVLLTLAAAVALLLGVIGIYGVISYIVSQRTGEIGVRLALGAEPGGVAGLIVRQGATVAIAGIAAGLVTALAGTRLIESILYGVSPRDPAVFASTTIALLAVALLACWLPARRAARLNAVEALRAE